MSYLRISLPSARPTHAREVREARALFERFHAFAPERAFRTACRRAIPPVLVRLGTLRGLIYASDRGQSGEPRTFVHFMQTPPLLCADPAGTQLYVLGGNYRVSKDGIVG